ncbi:hypothetical protein HYU06_06855 [Candidatus Woesearchaeota archaeon]|nr:hypothetical protein [Candidatus Woesearchaeota archaeon]
MNWFIVGATFDVVGKILIAITVLLVHRHVIKGHKIDKSVLKEMKREQVLGTLGIIFIISGYLTHVISL